MVHGWSPPDRAVRPMPSDLRGLKARAKVLTRTKRLIGGNPGDVKHDGPPAFRSCGLTTALDTGFTPCRGEPP